MSEKKEHTPNDQRSIVKNPNNEAFEADKINTEKQVSNPPTPLAPKKEE